MIVQELTGFILRIYRVQCPSAEDVLVEVTGERRVCVAVTALFTVHTVRLTAQCSLQRLTQTYSAL